MPLLEAERYRIWQAVECGEAPWTQTILQPLLSIHQPSGQRGYAGKWVPSLCISPSCIFIYLFIFFGFEYLFFLSEQQKEMGSDAITGRDVSRLCYLQSFRRRLWQYSARKMQHLDPAARFSFSVSDYTSGHIYRVRLHMKAQNVPLSHYNW